MKTFKPLKTRRNGKNQKGFLLVEVMVAMTVLSIGVLSMAGMQLTGIKNNHSAMLRSEAAIVVQNMADRMRGNFTGVVAGNYIFSGSSKFGSPSNQAETDINEVLDSIFTSHSSGALTIGCATTLAFVQNCSITLTWDDSRATGKTTGDTSEFTTNVFL